MRFTTRSLAVVAAFCTVAALITHHNQVLPASHTSRYPNVSGVASPLAQASPVFKPRCNAPTFPAPAPQQELGIDEQCSLSGSGGPEARQNMAKNNFCADGTPEEKTIDDLKQLQRQVEGDPKINFGDKASRGRQKGPTVKRAPLVALGEGKLVTLRGFVLIARQEGSESVNCRTDVPDNRLFHDIHISVVAAANTKLKNECSCVVAEMSPHHRPDSWTIQTMQKVANAHAPVRLTGQLFFDSSHSLCLKGKRVRSNPKRASLWEIHPIYNFEVCTSGCDGEGVWITLDEWAKTH